MTPVRVGAFARYLSLLYAQMITTLLGTLGPLALEDAPEVAASQFEAARDLWELAFDAAVRQEMGEAKFNGFYIFE